MAEVCRFEGIVVRMFPDDHAPPHFHVDYAGEQAAILIRIPAVLEGRLRPAQRRKVVAWARLRQAELLANWALVEAGKDPVPIAPPE